VSRQFTPRHLWIAASTAVVLAILSVSLPDSAMSSAPLHGTPIPRPTQPVATEVATFGEVAPTYYRDVQPIFAENCLGCHTADGIGFAALPMSDPDAIQAAAKDIARAVEARYMPPWMPGEKSPPLKHERKLTEQEITTISAWVQAGTPLGDPNTATPITPVALPSIRADAVLEMPVDYTPDDTLADDYRCFLIDPGFTRDTMITGFEIKPGQPSIVHHVILYQISADSRAEAARIEGRDGRPGWQCFGGPGVGARVNRNGGSIWVGAWVPGMVPTVFPAGTGVRIPAGNLIVMQVHYNLEAGAKPDRTRAHFEIAPADQTLRALRGWNIVAPVEIPCPEGETGEQCEREAALSGEDAVRTRAINTGLLLRCRKQLEDYAGQDAANVVSTCEWPVPVDGVLISAAGHMHERGKSFRLDLNPATPASQIVLDLPYWDFHWQGSYQFVTPIPVKRGDTMRIACTWDNTRKPNPRYIVWGEGTDDEMCLGVITILPD
jgi:hypothetical protein